MQGQPLWVRSGLSTPAHWVTVAGLFPPAADPQARPALAEFSDRTPPPASGFQAENGQPASNEEHACGPWPSCALLRPPAPSCRAVAGTQSSQPLPRVCFYGFNLNKGFLISCLRSCQSEKFLYYMRLEVLELSQRHNTQHHYPAAPYHSVPLRLRGPVPPCRSVPAASLPAPPTARTSCTATNVSFLLID